MKKRTKVILIILGILFLGYKGLEIWMENRLGSMINRNPDRAYNIQYKSIDLHTFFKGVTLDEVGIVPIKVDSGTVIRGTVNYANMDGLVWYELFLKRKLNIDGIRFINPTFVINLGTDSIKKSSGAGIQDLFGDIISRAKLRRFEIENGSFIVMQPGNQKIRGRWSNFNLIANDIKTDSVMLNHIIPFELGSLETSLDSMSYMIDEFTRVSSGKLSYTMTGSKLILNDLQMKFVQNWMEVSRSLGQQTDLMEVSLEEVYFEDLKASSGFYTDLDIEASKIAIRGLIFTDYRDKNMPRPPDKVKPMFKGMVDAIPITVKVDTILLENAAVHYGELGVGKSETGKLRFEDINGTITKLTTLPEEQKNYKAFEADIRSKLNGHADVFLNLTVPYDREAFHLTAHVGEMDLTRLNETVGPMAGIEVVSGKMNGIQFEMDATEYRSRNKLQFDYSDLKINVIKEGKDHENHSNAFLTSIANSAIRSHNVPTQGKYLTASYVSDRNRQRGPFNFMWHSLSDGMTHIVPGTMVQKLLGVDNKSKKQERRKKKNRKNR